MCGARFLLVIALVAGLPLVAPTSAEAVTLVARGSVNQLQVWGATPGATLELLDGSDAVVATGTADVGGALIFGIAPESTDDVPAGSGYRVREGGDLSNAVTVMDLDFADAAPPDDSIYNAVNQPDLPAPAYANTLTGLTQEDDDGFGYITTRDGTKLAVNVLAPYNPLNPPPAPWPVVINYSGYTPAAPGDADPVTTLMRAAGFAVVGVNMRGTGCSGGAYSYFEPLQGLDGYDVVEAIARQPWVAESAPATGFDSGPDVGMVGISFPGISQLFVGRTNPPSLAGIAPLSVLADSYRSTLYPGGILNDGFATGWVTDRENQAVPSGQPWAAHRISHHSDTICQENQRLKRQAPPLVARFEQDLLYQPDPGADLAPAEWVDDIDVPTFIAGSFQDEQTGGHWPTMLDDFDPAVLKRAVLFNGTHADALGPDALRDLLEFVDLYVARRPAQQKALLRLGAGEALEGTFGEPYTLAPFHGNPNTGTADVAYRTQTGYEGLDEVRVYWERGGPESVECGVDTGGDIATEVREPCDADEARGAPFARFITTHDTWPIPGVTADEWFLQPDGALADVAPTVADDEPRASSSWTYDNSRDQVGSYDGGSEQIWHKDATYDWEQPSEPTSLRYVSPAYDADHLYAGTGSVDLWLRSTADDVDVEVTLTEVRPDGEETYIQSGWLRASHRAEAPGSTALAPRHTHLAEEPAPADTFVPMRVELFPFTHVVRAGSRVAVTIAAPGGNRPFWHFASNDAPGAVNDIGHSVGRASHLTLPEVSVTLPANAEEIAPCGHLRSQPCRDVDPSTRPTGVSATIDAGGSGTDLARGIDVTWVAPEAPDVTSYDLEQLPGGQDLSDDATPGHRVDVPVGSSPPAGDPAFTVTASFSSGDGQPSDASVGVVPDHTYTDVPRDAWNIEAVDWVAAWQIVSGFTDGTFRNNAKATRGQVISWLWSTFGRPTAGSGPAFADATGTVRDATRWARGNGIASGFPGNRFRPGQRVTRAQAVAWLWAAAGRPEATQANGYGDVPVTAWYGPALDWAKEAEIVTGFTGNTFRPSSDVARGQTANWLYGTARDLQAP